MCGALITRAAATESRTQTCEDDQAVALLRVPDLAASQQHVVQIQRVALPLPQHRPRELVQPIVWLFALDESCTQSGTSGRSSQIHFSAVRRRSSARPHSPSNAAS